MISVSGREVIKHRDLRGVGGGGQTVKTLLQMRTIFSFFILHRKQYILLRCAGIRSDHNQFEHSSHSCQTQTRQCVCTTVGSLYYIANNVCVSQNGAGGLGFCWLIYSLISSTAQEVFLCKLCCLLLSSLLPKVNQFCCQSVDKSAPSHRMQRIISGSPPPPMYLRSCQLPTPFFFSSHNVSYMSWHTEKAIAIVILFKLNNTIAIIEWPPAHDHCLGLVGRETPNVSSFISHCCRQADAIVDRDSYVDL